MPEPPRVPLAEIDGIIRHMAVQERRLRRLRRALDAIIEAVPGSGSLGKRAIAARALAEDDGDA